MKKFTLLLVFTALLFLPSIAQEAQPSINWMTWKATNPTKENVYRFIYELVRLVQENGCIYF
jgi:hypothetical protein